MATATPNALQRLRAAVTLGSRWHCMANTLATERGWGDRAVGHIRTITRVGHSVFDCEQNGRSFRWEIPRAARDVEWLDDSTVRCALPVGLHSVTLRQLPPTDDQSAVIATGDPA